MGLVAWILLGLVAGGIAKALDKVGAWLIAFGGAFVLLMVFDAVVGRRDERGNAGARA